MDDNLERILSKADRIADDLREIRRYNRQTVLITMVLWMIVLPALLFGSIILSAWRLG